MSKEAAVAHTLMESPLFVLVVVYRGVIDHVEHGYDANALIAKGVAIGKAFGSWRRGSPSSNGDYYIVVWESSDDMEKAEQVWHYEASPEGS